MIAEYFSSLPGAAYWGTAAMLLCLAVFARTSFKALTITKAAAKTYAALPLDEEIQPRSTAAKGGHR